MTAGSSQRRRRRGRPPLAVVAGLVLAAGVAAGLVIQGLRARTVARAAFPTVEGRIRVSGIGHPIQIFRDRIGVPHVEARDEADAFFGLGFVHAQDRLAQMLWLARAARGRASEVAGPALLPADRLARLLDLAGLAEAQYEQLSAGARRLLDAYARGVTARIERIRQGRAARPLALPATGPPLEDWDPVDSLAILKLYAWGLSGTLDVNLVLADVIERLGSYGARPYFPRTDDAGTRRGSRPRVASRAGGAGAGLAVGGLVPDPLRRAARLEGRAIGSSAWVVSGSRTRSGLPILAGDAHLEPTAPAFLHIDHLRGGDLDVAGATIPGVPVVWTGANRRVAWASAHARAVTTDLYEEVRHDTDPGLYHDGKGWRKLARRVETIQVLGAPDEVLTVLSTRHGPLLEDLVGPGRRPLSLAWAGGLGDGAGSLEALLGVARANDAGELLRALRGHREPPLVVVYADANGALGMQVAGWIPRREFATGLVPLPGRARWYEWRGPLDFDELPGRTVDGSKSWAIAADQRLAQPGDQTRIEWLWRSGERARRIEQMLRTEAARGPLTLRRVAELQTDVANARARDLVERAVELSGPEEDLAMEASEVLGLLRGWDGRADARSVGSAAYHVFVERLTERLLEHHLGEELMRRYLALPQVDPIRIVLEMLEGAASRVATNGSADPEDVAEMVRSSLRETWFHLSFHLGPNRAKWSWGRLHPLRFRPFRPHSSRRRTAALGPFAYGGDGSTVNTAEHAPGRSFEVRVASTFRFAVDASALDEALVALAPGQSEHPRHPQHVGGLERWLDGRPALLATSRLLVEETSSSRLRLEASAPGGG